MKIKVKVTEEILRRSANCSTILSGAFKPPYATDGEHLTNNCAIALAVREIFPDASVEHAGINTGLIEEGEPLIDLPGEAAVLMTQFDFSTPAQRREMAPAEFEIDVPSHVIHRIGISQVYKVLSESRTMELVSIK